MKMEVGRCEYCDGELPERAKTGRPRRFCSNRCQLAASRSRRSSYPASSDCADESSGPEPVEAFLVGRSAPPDDQVLAAVHETILLVITFRRLGTEARRQFAWRCAGMSDALEAALARYFKAKS